MISLLDGILGSVCKLFVVRMRSVVKYVTPLSMILIACCLIYLTKNNLLAIYIGSAMVTSNGILITVVSALIMVMQYWVISIKPKAKFKIASMGFVSNIMSMFMFICCICNAGTYAFSKLTWIIPNIVACIVLLYAGMFINRYWFDVILYNNTRYAGSNIQE